MGKGQGAGVTGENIGIRSICKNETARRFTSISPTTAWNREAAKDAKKALRIYPKKRFKTSFALFAP